MEIVTQSLTMNLPPLMHLPQLQCNWITSANHCNFQRFQDYAPITKLSHNLLINISKKALGTQKEIAKLCSDQSLFGGYLLFQIYLEQTLCNSRIQIIWTRQLYHGFRSRATHKSALHINLSFCPNPNHITNHSPQNVYED